MRPDLDRCLDIAEKEYSRHLQTHKHWSFIWQGNDLIAWGRNIIGEPTRQHRYGYRSNRHGLHAEVTALNKARGLMDIRKPWAVVNIRLGADLVPTISAPCSVCYNFMKACGCKQFYYTDPYGRFVKLLP